MLTQHDDRPVRPLAVRVPRPGMSLLSPPLSRVTLDAPPGLFVKGRRAKSPRRDCYEMRIHKRLIDLVAPTEIVKQIIINIEAGVEVEVTIAA